MHVDANLITVYSLFSVIIKKILEQFRLQESRILIIVVPNDEKVYIILIFLLLSGLKLPISIQSYRSKLFKAKFSGHSHKLSLIEVRKSLDSTKQY